MRVYYTHDVTWRGRMDDTNEVSRCW